ncbi:hypothetical protein HYH03_002239 [Edaphochlamys debaryana]|uniref:SRCR domain-containing protein n=1 Tax=Edaphochlamys debaryana TaxID=47281 RepID=A0A835YLM4_9CHLO|nr:hypothetical protein HYH03_002239 [Edaphochlamys debaryana]|eukprot:KAG2499954.1 hypothetical protein HYH03_002239 [Edaphochlamys debaryana]
MWGTVCDDYFGTTAANVACRQLGYDYGEALHDAPFGPGSGPIWMDDVQCLGGESRLWDCDSLKPRGKDENTNCDHREDVAVRCYDYKPPPPPGTPSPPLGPVQPDGVVRLVNGNSSSLGLVQISMLGQWGVMCSATWTVKTAVVACRSLGLTGGTLLFGRQYGTRTAPSGPVLLKNLRCNGSEASLMACSYDALLDDECEPFWAAAVMCGVEDGALRLANGTESGGRLEVLHNGVWGSVCWDEFGPEDASVACRQLGFAGGLVAWPPLKYGAGINSVWMDELDCYGDESRLDACLFDGWGYTDCSHFNDVGVECYTTAPPPAPPSDGTIELVNGNSSSLGLVQISMDGVWGVMCSATWTVQTAVVACRSLGLTGGTLLFGPQYGTQTPTDAPIYLKNLICDGSEDSLLDCSYDALLDDECEPFWAAAVMCEVEDGALRLANGTESGGRLEVLHNGVWGSVCWDEFGRADANVACRQLGFAGGMVAAPQLKYGLGRHVVWMDEVNCTGDETRLDACPFDGWGVTDCSHFNDVGVECFTTQPAPVISPPPPFVRRRLPPRPPQRPRPPMQPRPPLPSRPVRPPASPDPPQPGASPPAPSPPDHGMPHLPPPMYAPPYGDWPDLPQPPMYLSPPPAGPVYGAYPPPAYGNRPPPPAAYGNSSPPPAYGGYGYGGSYA